jgi:UDP-glucose 4-epimerase
MKAFVAGGAGFIGCHLCERLVERGYHVTVADNLSLGHREFIAPLEAQGALDFIEMDVTDVDALSALFAERGFDVVFHMAANSDIARSFADPMTDFGSTLQTTYAVLDAMRRNDVKQIIFASTSAIYGEAQGKLSEDHGPLLPISHYGAAKLASEAFISSYVENYGMQAWITRFPNVVGDRLTHGAVYDFVRKLRRDPTRLEVLGNGTQTKPYLHADDLVEAILLGWEKLDGKINVYNIGGETRCSVAKIAQIVIEEFGGNARIDYTGGDRGWVGDVPSVDYDVSRVSALGWSPKLDSEGAIRAAARWMVDSTAESGAATDSAA